ncbi:7615_t:CDS:1, partial [Funneliformis caledonium]
MKDYAEKLKAIYSQEKFFYNFKYTDFKNIQKIGGVFTTVYRAKWKYGDGFLVLKSFNFIDKKAFDEIMNM